MKEERLTVDIHDIETHLWAAAARLLRRQYRLAATGLIAVFLLASCGGGSIESTTSAQALADSTEAALTTSTSTTTTIPPTTTTTLSEEEVAAAQFEADVSLIKQLWRRFSDAWAGSGAPQSVYDYMAENTHPAYECTADHFAAGYDYIDGYQEEVIVDASTIERDDGWAIPSGVAEGFVPQGRVYIYTLLITYSAPGYDSSSESLEAHAVVEDDGDAYFFYSCNNNG